MGTVATVEIVDRPDAESLIDATFAWLHEVDRRFSPFKRDSELCRFNRGEIALGDCSAELRTVLDRCTELWRRTDGYFDVYAGGQLDPCGYVKGWAVEVASERLSLAGAGDHLVDAGGDIQTRGRPAPNQLWEIGIRDPWRPRGICHVITGTDLAVATSGTYERGRHVRDPLTGRLPADLRSVTVIGLDLGEADAFATAAVAMGERALSWLATLPQYESLVIAEDGRAFASVALSPS
jgi:thiamine biosynthesis lipoprotein